MSCAYKRKLLSMKHFLTSCMKIIKSNGPRCDPCGTLDVELKIFYKKSLISKVRYNPS